MDTQFIQGESSITKWNYDVFLSFRGEDTRKTFIGHFYTRLCQVGVDTFIDDEELRKGDVISTKLEKTIEVSRISVVVFSKNYASSSWCLDELVKILECRDKLKQIVLPVFYDVDPSQVRNQSGCFGEGFAMRKERSFGDERMEKWKAALTEAANLSGWDLQNVANGHESKFIESIIKQVLQVVNQTPLDVAWHPIGVDTRVEHIELLLQNECEDEVRMVGIYGVGGIGKTTLAKAIYNQTCHRFDSSCFLSNVRAEADAFNGLVKLQEQLLNQILKTKDVKVSSVAEGVNLIKTKLGSKKVLIILDDIDHMSQLESLTRERSWFGAGSLIVVTTRDEHLLCRLRENERYEAKLLNDNEALQLFSLHAFNGSFPPHEYVNLAKDIIKYSGGLPLALVTLGSHLQGRSTEEWRYEFKKLRAIPHRDIQKILQISFDGLDRDIQSVFLDIACAFHGFSKDEVCKTLNACGFSSESAIATLVQRQLLQRGHFLVMHDLVRDMGREIVSMESPRDPGKRSRLFNPQEVRDVLQGNKGSENVEVLVVERGAFKGMNLSTKAFQKMINLRVLNIDDLNISGDFELLSKELRWLSWEECPLKCIPSNFPFEKLVVLNMRESNIQEFSSNFQHCRNLKDLNLANCKHLGRTPNFNGSLSLETLCLTGCSNLKEIHPSIGNLNRLTGLFMMDCKKISNLPSSICKLKSLQYLNIRSCSSLLTLPVDIGDMQSLRHLLACDTGIKQLPRSLEMIRDLSILELGTRNVENKRSFSGRIVQIQSLSSSVSHLSLTYCNLSEADIPGDVWSLSSLQHLDLSGNSFRCLHFDFSKLRSLTSLFLNNCENLHTLSSLSNKNLCKLEIANCEKLVDITGFDNLPLQGQIDMRYCTSLQNPFNEGFFSAAALSFLPEKLEIYLQSTEIPDWCSNQVTASSICFTMPTVHDKKYQFLGMILWCVHKFVIEWDTLSYQRGLKFFIVGKKYSIYDWRYDFRIPDGYAEQSCVLYTSCIQEPFHGQIMEGGEKIQIVEFGGAIVKNIGIHLLYLDQHGNVTSLPAQIDHSHAQMTNKNQENKQNLSGKEPQKSFKQSLSRKEPKMSFRPRISLKKIIACFFVVFVFVFSFFFVKGNYNVENRTLTIKVVFR
ncbi:disease resistance protein RUN1 [Capsicum annuum]|uniref:disease resistance protein RUN1 n=1 Tax=Capsicum annuum TaxID=4072 RepID=UPI001FB0A4BD|nr:disease resistance protein RUN1 [Capsicum annuum]